MKISEIQNILNNANLATRLVTREAKGLRPYIATDSGYIGYDESNGNVWIKTKNKQELNKFIEAMGAKFERSNAKASYPVFVTNTNKEQKQEQTENINIELNQF